MKHIASCSFGKDSVATVLLALQNNEPLDEIVYCEVMFDRDISGEIPEHRAFIYEKAIPYFKQRGVETVILRAEWTYINHFYSVVKSGAHNGMLRGFPICGICSICRDCKLPPIRQYIKALPPNTVQYIGIAKDEQERLLRLDGQRVSLLNKYGMTESMAANICKENGLLSPIYEFTNRGGCWFCPNAKEKELRHLYDHHKDLWARLLELQGVPNKATELFNRNQKFSDIDRQFRLNDAQLAIFDFLE